MKMFLKILCYVAIGLFVLMLIPLFWLMGALGVGLIKVILVLAFIGFVVYEIATMFFGPSDGIITIIEDDLDDN